MGYSIGMLLSKLQGWELMPMPHNHVQPLLLLNLLVELQAMKGMFWLMENLSAMITGIRKMPKLFAECLDTLEEMPSLSQLMDPLEMISPWMMFSVMETSILYQIVHISLVQTVLMVKLLEFNVYLQLDLWEDQRLMKENSSLIMLTVRELRPTFTNVPSRMPINAMVL